MVFINFHGVSPGVHMTIGQIQLFGYVGSDLRAHVLGPAERGLGGGGVGTRPRYLGGGGAAVVTRWFIGGRGA